MTDIRTVSDLIDQLKRSADEGGFDPTDPIFEIRRGAASGVASLDATTKVPTAELATGVADATTFLSGDRSWRSLAAAGGFTKAGNAFGMNASVGLTDNFDLEVIARSSRKYLSCLGTELVLNDGAAAIDIRIEAGVIDANAVFVQAGTGRIGFGTASPAEKVHINGNLRVGTNLIVDGDFTVSGTKTTINSTVVDIADRVLHVNHSVGVVPVPVAMTGISVHRGATAGPVSRDHAALVWRNDSDVVDPSTGTGTFSFIAQTGGDDFTSGLFLNVEAGTITAWGHVVTPTVGPSDAQQHTLPAVVSDTLALLLAAQEIASKTFTDNLVWKSGTGFKGTLDHANTVDRVYTFQDAAGTVAFLADIPVVTPSGWTDDGTFVRLTTASDVVVGGVAASDTITIRGTSHATPGVIILNDLGGHVGVGASPTTVFHARGTLGDYNGGVSIARFEVFNATIGIDIIAANSAGIVMNSTGGAITGQATWGGNYLSVISSRGVIIQSGLEVMTFTNDVAAGIQVTAILAPEADNTRDLGLAAKQWKSLLAGTSVVVSGNKVIGARGAALTAQLTTITHSAPGTPDYAIQDLVAAVGFGFVTADEAQTVLSVISNLQVRVAELESRLASVAGHGLFT